MTDFTNSIRQPVWLLSMDSEHFFAAPTTTAALKAWHRRYSARAGEVDIRLVHFRDAHSIEQWRQEWLHAQLADARAALDRGQQPLVGLSFYTWNAAEFLALVRFLRQTCPGLAIVVGGPHVQQADTYLRDDPIDAVVLGPGEVTFQQLVDAPERTHWLDIRGLALLRDGAVLRTGERERINDLDSIPSPLDEIELTDANGAPLYESIAYETSRGCPYSCAFCEWGTGDIGGKMYQFSLERIRADWEKIVAAGIPNIWLADSNFGALREDLEKARIICELKRRTGLPRTFATSWSKKHNARVQEIVLMLHEHGLLPHYQLALQTLTPLALKLANRQNMAANKYEPIARQMAAAGVPIAAELIWGLPGDNLAEFEANLDRLLATFPNINIFGYTLLPGTEFFARRQEYQIETIPVAGYGKAKGEYVVGCHTFSHTEGIEGYFLITAHMILVHGHVLPLTIRYLAMTAGIPATPLLRALLAALVAEFGPQLTGADVSDKMQIYERRAAWYLLFLSKRERTFKLMRRVVDDWLAAHDAGQDLRRRCRQVLALDEAYCPRPGPRHDIDVTLNFDGRRLTGQLEALDFPDERCFLPRRERLVVEHPGGLGEVLRDPDGGSWIRGRPAAETPAATVIAAAH